MAGEDRERGDFEKGLARVARRRAIERHSQQEREGPELRREVRKEMIHSNISGLVNTLVEKEFVVDEKRAVVAADLSIELQEHFKLRGLAVVLMGSSVHGGVLTRRTMGAKKSGDFDYGIVLDRKDIDMKKFRQIRNEMKDYVKNRLVE